MNYRQLRRHLRTVNARADKLEAAYRPQIEQALDKQVNAFFDYAQQYGIAEALQLMDTIVTDAPLRPVIRSLYITEGRKQGLWEQARLNKLYGAEEKQLLGRYDVKAMEFITGWIETLTNFFNVYGFQAIVNITTTTRNFLRDRVTKGLEDNLTLQQIRDSIVSEGINKNRATTIVRTEVLTTMNNANHEAARGSRLKFVKRWSSTHDKRTRHSHVNLDGETVALETPFSNNGMYPGDPSLPGKERINCRCTSVNEPLRDAMGRVIRR